MADDVLIASLRCRIGAIELARRLLGLGGGGLHRCPVLELVAREPQGAHAARIKPVVVGASDDPHQDTLAAGAAQHNARAAHVCVQRPDLTPVATVVALLPFHGHLAAEDLDQQASDGIAIQHQALCILDVHTLAGGSRLLLCIRVHRYAPF